MDCVSLVERDIVAYSWLESSLGERKADLICSVRSPVADVNEFGNEGELVFLYLSVGDDRRREIWKCRHLICRRKILTIRRPVDTHADKYARGKDMSGFTSLGKKSIGGGAGGSSLNANSVGPFGTSLVSEQTPTAQGAFIFSINTSTWFSSSVGTTGGAAVVNSNGVMTASSGNSLSGSSMVRLARGVKYRAGQGSMVRLTAVFDSGQPDTLQLAGMGNRESGYFFAMSGSNFGILHRERSALEVRKFTITSAPAGSATLTLTLDGQVVSVPVVGGSSTSQTAYQITVSGSFADVGAGWTAEANGPVVYFTSQTPGPHGGTFSLFNGAGNIATVTTSTSGVLPTDTFIAQSSWNVDTMNGSGQSRFTLNPQSGNVYGVGLQYLGYGNATFSIEDPETGFLTNCHMIRNAGTRTTPVLKDPHVSAMWKVVNSGSLASSVTIKGVSAANFVEGKILRNIGPSFSVSAERTGANDVENVLTPVLTIRANSVHRGRACFSEIDPFNMTVGSDTGSASATTLVSVFVYKNANLTGPVNFISVDADRSICSYDISATGVSVTPRTQLIKTLVVAANRSEVVDLLGEDFYLCPGETLTIAAKCNKNNTSDVIASLSWFEDQ